MKVCHVCGETFEDYVEVCSDCGAILKTEEEMRAIEEEKEAEINIKNPVLVETVEDVITAEIFSDMLKEANIKFYCEEPSSMMMGFSGGVIAFKIFVDEKDLAAASEIYKNVTETNLMFDDGFDDDLDGEAQEEDKED